MILHPAKYPVAPRRGEKWDECVWCGAKYKWVEVFFDSGSVEPTADETITGDTSEATGVVVEDSLVLFSGSWAGGDAAGVLMLSTPTGIDFDSGDWGEDNETVTGGTGGANMFTLNTAGVRKMFGKLYPESELIERDGKYYCKFHYDWRFRGKDRDDDNASSSDYNEDTERGPEW